MSGVNWRAVLFGLYVGGAIVTAVLILAASFYIWSTNSPRPRIRWQQFVSLVAASALWPLFWPYALGRETS